MPRITVEELLERQISELKEKVKPNQRQNNV